MRHGDSKITLEHYAHVIGETERFAAEKFSQRGQNMAQLESDPELESTPILSPHKQRAWRKRVGVEPKVPTSNSRRFKTLPFPPSSNWSQFPAVLSVISIERVLRAYATAHVEDAHWIEACLRFRQAVGEEIERLLCAGPERMALPKVDDRELGPVEQGSAAS